MDSASGKQSGDGFLAAEYRSGNEPVSRAVSHERVRSGDHAAVFFRDDDSGGVWNPPLRAGLQLLQKSKKCDICLTMHHSMQHTHLEFAMSLRLASKGSLNW